MVAVDDGMPPESYEVEGFRKLVDDDYSPPPPLTRARFRKLSDAEQHQWLEARLEHLGRPVLVQTNDMTRVFNQMWSLMVMNRHAIDRRVGIVSGQSGVGKTTIVRTAGVLHERAVKRKFPDYRECGRIPVVMVDVPAKCTCRAIDKAFLDFLHVPYRERAAHDELKHQVVRALAGRRTELIVIDDLQRLNTRVADGIDASDLLKEYHDLVPATFVFAGMHLDSAGFFSGDSGTQILNRGALTEILPYSDSNDEQRQRWLGLVDAVESDLRLLNHSRGTLARPTTAQYLFDRTGGSIAALTILIQFAAVRAAYEAGPPSDTDTDTAVPPERITRSLLRSVATTAAGEMRAQQATAAKQRSRKRVHRK